MASRRHRCVHSLLLIGLPICCAALAGGCGTSFGESSAARILFVAECEEHADAGGIPADRILLDWTGGTSPIYPDDPFPGIDLTDFPTSDGGTLADHADAFKEDVRQEISAIFCAWDEANVVVANGEADWNAADTIVLLTHAVPPNGSADIGEGEFDPCNRQNDNAALVYGKRLRQLGGDYTYDEWVTVFANVCAHEVAHTLGYGHIDRDDAPQSERALYVELMLGGHTMAEMRRPQRFVVDQSYCPDNRFSARPLHGDAVIPCRVLPADANGQIDYSSKPD